MEKQIAEKATERAKQKLVDKLTKRQKLGRGQFEEEEQPFLLQVFLIHKLFDEKFTFSKIFEQKLNIFFSSE